MDTFTPPIIRHPFERHSVGITFQGDGRTHQDSKDECDINYMMSQYQSTGQINTRKDQPQYIDVSNANDYNDAINNIENANRAFMSLPAKLRKQFNNDPAEFLEAIDTGEAEQVLRDAGLTLTQPATEPPPAPSEPSPDENAET